MYTKENLTFGFELELSNVIKSTKLPEYLGKWEFCEADIINTRGKYANISADPKGINPPVGGEINTIPSLTKEDQVERIMRIIDLFKNLGQDPDVGMTSHSHIHVHIVGLENDIESLLNLVDYINTNQDLTFEKVYRFDGSKIPEGFSKAKTYLKNDGARRMPNWMADNICYKCNTIPEVLTMLARGKDSKVPVRPVRYGVNLYSLKNCKTIEFRCFRGTLDKEELSDCFEFVERFILEGLKYGKPVIEILKEKDWKFPAMQFNKDQAEGWLNTKHHVELVNGKNRKYWEAD